MQGNDYELTETHVSIYHGYTNFVKWGTISIIALLILMAIFTALLVDHYVPAVFGI